MKLKYVTIGNLKICIVLLVISQLVFSACDKEEIIEVPVDSLSINVLSSPVDICVSNKCLYVSDLQNRTIYKIKDNNIIQDYCSVGKAPGDIICPEKIQCKNDTLFVLDTALARLSAFDTEFNYIFSIKLNSLVYSFVVGNSKNIFISKYFGDSLIIEYDYYGNIKKEFLKNTYPAYDPNNPINNAINIFVDKNNELMYSYLLKSFIEIINIREKYTISKIKYNVDLPSRKVKIKFEENRYFTECSGTIRCSDFKKYNDKLIIMCGGGFEGNKGDLGSRKPIKGMKYYMLIENKDKFQKFRINLPLENGYGYRFAILEDKIYFVSFGSPKIYYIEKSKVCL